MLNWFTPGEKLLSAAFRAHLNELVDGINRALGLNVQPPLTLHKGPHGQTIGRERRPGQWFKLNGASSPYTGSTAQERDGSGNWISAGWTADVNEVKGVSGLANKIMWCEPNGYGSWDGQYIGLCKYTLKPTVRGCLRNRGGVDPGYAGVTVTASQVGQSDVTGTTASDGTVSLVVPNDSAWTVKATAPNARFVDTSISMTPACNSTVTGTIDLAPASGYACSPCCNDPLATTLNASWKDDFGNAMAPFTLVYNSTAGGWIGCGIGIQSTCPTCTSGLGSITPLSISHYYFLPAVAVACQLIRVFILCKTGSCAGNPDGTDNSCSNPPPWPSTGTGNAVTSVTLTATCPPSTVSLTAGTGRTITE